MKSILGYVLGAAAIGLALAPGLAARADGDPAKLAAPPSPAEVDRLLGGPGAPTVGLDAASGGVVAVPFLFEDGHIIVEAAIDGQAAKPFIFDTGATTTLTREAATELHLELRGDGPLISGFGRRLVASETASVDRIAIGAATLGYQKIKVADLRNALVDRGARPRAAGLIGAELLRTRVVRIDYANQQLTLMPAGAFRPPSNVFALPLTLPIVRGEGLTSPLVSAQIEHVPGRFMVDTGSPGQIHIFAGFESEHDLVAHYPKTLEIVTAGGIGGHASMRLGLGETFALGPAAFSTPFVSTPADGGTRRSAALSSSDGLIGNGVLAHFIVTFDYKAGRLYFEAPRGTTLTKGWYGTGIVADKPERDSFEIIDIIPGTAAERAGLRRGERIVAVNGDPARDLSIGDFTARSAAIARRTATVETAGGRRIDLDIGQILP